MPQTYDTILRRGLVVDPVNGVHRQADVAMSDGRIAAIGEIDGTAREDRDVAGLMVMPGIVDAHVHLSPWLGGGAGHRMLALAGVTFALDLAGPIDGVTRLAAESGCGVTIGCIDYVRPGHTVGSEDPGEDELRDALAKARRAGAIGFKILGGHFPLTREASARVIDVAAREGAYVAFHSGTLSTPQSVAGMRESCELAAGNPLHLAHINSYTRGLDASAVIEAEEAIAILAETPNVWSESYLAPINGNSGKCADGVPESVATQKNLKRGGFPATTEGMVAAISAGWAQVHVLQDGVHVLTGGEVGLTAWRAAESNIGISFEANPPEPRIHLATAKRADGSFAVDALATDGGGIPRNDLISRGLALYHLDALTLDDFVLKTSAAPARALGLAGRKGHLGIGADADVTVIDVARLSPVESYAHGRAVLRDGEVVGRGARMLVPPEGRAHVESLGIETLVAEPGSMLSGRGA
ncbi:dihydroorotase-like cyclic amidohydrolase [Palleronia aestuarii]|uniref:Dihydroorotase-like cyclic amidohydrolase n=1 Tax=Palleronia aestuarii TaxID=568105 RepID=A0A2W7N9R5_9RHOB|nr:amidohydrolase family protein [Palleronia aestuarii]PZX14887.1 dihydroorotase-like cyclic amidohydrolase [Palleronia aestuarii]